MIGAKKVVLCCGAFTNANGIIPNNYKVAGFQPWGKIAYHAQISKKDAEKLAKIPCWKIIPPGNSNLFPKPDVEYQATTTKTTNYVYGFPPIKYRDGKYYIKIGHSPYDPLIKNIGGNGLSIGERLGIWFEGKTKKVKEIQSKSNIFFRSILTKLFPKVKFLGGYSSRCVTTKT